MTAPMSAADGLGKRYRRRWALTRLHLEHPGRATSWAWSGPNGAGKSTLLRPGRRAARLRPRARSRCSAAAGGRARSQLAKVGFVAQDTPVYAG